MNDFLKEIENIVNEQKFFEGELKIGYLKNGIFAYNLRDNVFYGFKNFIGKRNIATNLKQTVYKYYDLILISKDENSHVCFKVNDYNLKYVTPFENKLSLRFKINNLNVMDNIYFPCIDEYNNFEEQNIDRYEMKFKNSIINIDFININDKVNSIILKFNVDSNNLQNFTNNLKFILSKFYRTDLK